MRNYYIVEPSGRIRAVLTCSLEMAVMQIRDGDTLHAGHADPRRQYVVAGKLADIPAPPGPEPHHVFDHAAGVWIDSRTDAERAADALAALRARRAELLAASDEIARQLLDELLPAPLRAYRKALRDYPATVVDPLDPPPLPSLPDPGVTS